MSTGEAGDLPRLGAPARRALASAGIRTLADLGKFEEGQVAALHGMGPNAMTRLREAMAAQGLTFSSKRN